MIFPVRPAAIVSSACRKCPIPIQPFVRNADVSRQVTAPSFRLAGSGWYETDFKKDGDKKKNLADTGSSGTSGSGTAE